VHCCYRQREFTCLPSSLCYVDLYWGCTTDLFNLLDANNYNCCNHWVCHILPSCDQHALCFLLITFYICVSWGCVVFAEFIHLIPINRCVIGNLANCEKRCLEALSSLVENVCQNLSLTLMMCYHSHSLEKSMEPYLFLHHEFWGASVFPRWLMGGGSSIPS
jgi:hypothetical protein